jgi:hypothetical protein
MRWPGAIVLLLAATTGLLLHAPPVRSAEIQGRVVVTGTVPAPRKIPITIDQYVCGTEQTADDLVVSGAREVRNAVVWLESPPPDRSERVPVRSAGGHRARVRHGRVPQQ